MLARRVQRCLSLQYSNMLLTYLFVSLSVYLSVLIKIEVCATEHMREFWPYEVTVPTGSQEIMTVGIQDMAGLAGGMIRVKEGRQDMAGKAI